MPSKNRRKKKVKSQKTNWTLIGGIVGGGVLFLIALFVLSTREAETLSLTEYCQENSANCVVEGDSAAAVTVVEISDFGCSHCRDFHRETWPQLAAEYVETGQVRWVSFPFALRPETVPAANAAMCAGEQDAYFEYSDALFSFPDQRDALTDAGFQEAAAAVTLDMSSFQECVDEARYVGTIEANNNAARKAGVSATPTFFINGRKLEGAHPFTTFQQQINQLLGW